MKKIMILLMGIIVLKVSAQMAVHDETNRQQLYLNAKAQIAAVENSRKWLDLIIKHTGNTYNVSNSIDEIIKQFKKDFQIFTKKVGDPQLIDTGVHSSGEAKVIKNLSLQNIRNTAKNGKDLKSYDSEALYGAESKPELKYHVAEAAYVNFERVLAENRDTKRSLIVKRGALALGLKNARSLAEAGKISAALQVVNGKLATIQEQEQQAFNKLLAIQVRNEQKEKLNTKAKSRQRMLEFLNADPLQNSPGSKK
ncbi:MAG: hypothetical protein KAS17_10210 [Victivallaceae bacterium]|nr:hypothetical protein [Victivallaceae bacterium]